MQAATFSVVSHGHGTLVRALLGDMNRAPALQGARVIVTLNLRDEPFDPTPFAKLDIEVLKNAQPLGFGANHNQAFSRCRTPWFVILNPDLRFVDAEPFTALLDCGNRHARTGLVAPQVVSSSGAPEDSVRANLTPWSLLERHLLGRRRPVPASQPARIGQPFFWVAGMCLCVNSEAFRAVDGFDERYFLYCEDYDLCAQALQRWLLDRRRASQPDRPRRAARQPSLEPLPFAGTCRAFCASGARNRSGRSG